MLGDVTEVFADQGGVLEIMMGGNELVPARTSFWRDGPDDELIEHQLFLGIGQPERRRHAEKKQSRKELFGFYWLNRQACRALLSHLESGMVVD